MKNVFSYITEKNLPEAIKLVKSLGYSNPQAKDEKQLKNKIAFYLADYYKRNKDNPQTIIDLVEIHPDKDIIQKALIAQQNKANQISQPDKKNADGCNENGKWANCSGCSMLASADAVPASTLSQQNINFIIMGASIILLTGLITTIYLANKK